MMQIVDTTLGMAIRMSTPYLYAALGGMIAQHAGVYNFALEGMMLGGAFFAYLFACLSKSILAGILAAIFSGIIFGFIFSFFIMRFSVSQMVLGLGFNTLFLGITGVGLRHLNKDPSLDLRLDHLMSYAFSATLTNIPILGNLFFKQNIMSYIIFVFYILYAYFLKRTRRGLALRAVGEDPQTAESAGIDVVKYRYFAIVISCVFASLGGAFLTLTQVNRFSENMTSGRGWIAISAIVLGRLKPRGVLFACLLFGLTSAISNQIQVLNIGVPYQIALMLPYILAILALISTKKEDNIVPASLGKAYQRKK